MSKQEMAAWYWAICVAAKDMPCVYVAGDEGLDAYECWEAFFMEWPRLLFVEAGRPGGFPWNAETE